MNDDDIFDAAAKSRGGLFRFPASEQFPMFAKQRSDALILHYSSASNLVRPVPKIICNFVDNSSINAFAKKHEGCYVIGIHRGLVTQVMDTISSMTGDPNVFPNLKDNALRDWNAKHLAMFALDFIFEHEFQHVICGHVDYFLDRFSSPEFSEFDLLSAFRSFTVDQTKLAYHDLQVLEMDADANALGRVCMMAKRTFDSGQSQAPPEIAAFWTDLLTVWGDIFFSLSVVFRILGDVRIRDTTTHSAAHPSPTIRQYMLAHTFANLNEQNDVGLAPSKLWDSIRKRFEEVDRSFEIITGKKTNPDSFNPKYTSQHPAITTLRETWNQRMRDELEPFSYVELPVWAPETFEV